MGLQEMGKEPHYIHQVRKTSRGRKKERRKKEIQVFEHKLFMVHPALRGAFHQRPFNITT